MFIKCLISIYCLDVLVKNSCIDQFKVMKIMSNIMSKSLLSNYMFSTFHIFFMYLSLNITCIYSRLVNTVPCSAVHYSAFEKQLQRLLFLHFIR